jgi:NADPH:quinone reductase-like Zn-dependent oxidoreductase
MVRSDSSTDSCSTLATFLEGYKNGHLKPLPEVHLFKVGELEQAFRYLQNGSHIGKIVVTSMDDLETIPAKKVGRALEFDSNASYLLTGGTGGLGKSMATWLVERGARSLTLLSRSAGVSEDSKEFIAELESMGCAVAAVAGGADKMDDVKAAVAASTSPIKGVFHLAMVLRVSLNISCFYFKARR